MRTKWKVEGDPTSEFIYMDKLSNRDAIIYISNKYKNEILYNKFLKDSGDYNKVANDFGITSRDLYMYLTYRLEMNQLSNKFDEYAYEPSYNSTEAEKKKKQREKEKVLKEQIFYSPLHIWRVLAYYCTFHSFKKAKSVLKDIQRYHYSHTTKGWNPLIKKRLQEIFTPMFFSEENYLLSNILMCKLIKKEKKGIYKGELIDYGQKEDGLFKLDNHFAPECLVILNDEEKIKKIDDILKDKRIPVVKGSRQNPKRNIINEVFEITDTKSGSLRGL